MESLSFYQNERESQKNLPKPKSAYFGMDLNSATQSINSNDDDIDIYLGEVLNDILNDDPVSPMNSTQQHSLSAPCYSKQQNKRKFSSFDSNGESDEDCDKITLGGFLKIDPSSQLSKVAENVSLALNHMNIKPFENIVQRINHPNKQYFIWCPGACVERQGLYIGKQLVETVMSTLTRITSKLTRSQVTHTGNSVKIISHTRIRGIRLNCAPFNRFMGLKDELYLSDVLLDAKKTPKKDIVNMRAIERLAHDSGKQVDICVKMISVDEFDIASQCIRRNWLVIRMSSLRMVK